MPRGTQYTTNDLVDKLNRTMAELRKHAKPGPDPRIGFYTGRVTQLVGELFHFPPYTAKNGSPAWRGADTLLNYLRKLGLLRMAAPGTSGVISQQHGETLSVYMVNLTHTITAADIARARKLISEQIERSHERKRREAREARLAPEHGEQAEGGPVTTRHFHEGPTTHQHLARTELHYHASDFDGLTYAGIVKVEHRHHTHTKEQDSFHAHAKAAGANGVHREPVTDPTSGRLVMSESPERDGRYRKLLDIIGTLEAKLGARERELDKLDTARLEAERERDELRRLLDQATDPSAQDADEVIARYTP